MDSRFSWTVITHSYQGENGESLSETIPLDALVNDLSEWFGLTPRQRDKLVDLGMVNFIPHTNGECFGFYVNTEEMTGLKEEILPQVEHVAKGNRNSYLYSVRHLINYDQLWEMFNLDPDEYDDSSGTNPPWDEDVQAEFEVATILWQFNDLNGNRTDIDVCDVTSYREIFRGTYATPEYHFEVPRSAYSRIFKTIKANHSR
jgi:hypothetical protein